MAMKKKRGKEGNATLYTTRNQALTRLQIKLPEFRRLCILKGIHPREPKKKTKGHNKTYYHVKDINFLAHEPLLSKGREIKAYDKKIKRARGKQAFDEVERLKKRRPTYTLDHIVRERYPTFIDAVRDIDDPLTLVHLFAVLPAEKRKGINPEFVQDARRLSLEFQAYVTRMHALRRVFVSVKGIYYQADILGQTITWLTPHALGQALPDDVDYRVMLTFLEFYEVMLGFVFFKLYSSLHVPYPPVLDSKLDEAAAGLTAVMMDLAQQSGADRIEEAGGKGGKEAGKEEAAEGKSKRAKVMSEEEKKEASLMVAHKESNDRLASLTEKLAAVDKAIGSRVRTGEEAELDERADGEGAAMMVDVANPSAAEKDVESDEDKYGPDGAQCARLFRGLTFFLGRETPKESLLLVIRAFGGNVGWQGEGSPIEESDETITHHVVDRPVVGHRFLSREYVQPQWVYDSANQRFLLPVDPYIPGVIPPPHLSPFINDEDEGYTPEYAETVRRLKANAEEAGGIVMPLDGGEENLAAATAALERSEEVAAAAEQAELAKQETQYVTDLKKELKGHSYSETILRESNDAAEVDEEDEEEEEESSEERERQKEREEARKRKEALLPSKTAAVTEDEEAEALAQIMMPRQKKKLYDAMQRGIGIKQAGVDKLKERRQKLDQKKANGGGAGNGQVNGGPPRKRKS